MRKAARNLAGGFEFLGLRRRLKTYCPLDAKSAMKGASAFSN